MTEADTKALELAADRAAHELRAGRPLLFEGAEPALALAAETAGLPLVASLRALGPAALVLTLRRAQALKVRTAGASPVLIALDGDMGDALVGALADPTGDMDRPLQGPFTALRGDPPPAAKALIQLARRARLLPAGLIVRGAAAELQRFATAESVLRFPAAAFEKLSAGAGEPLTLVGRARVPLVDAVETHLVAFRPADGGLEHIAVLVGDPPRHQPVLTRLHSECFTGDLLGSMRCDCGEQLRGAIRAIAEAGGGVLLYLAQEGRGIGLINKLRAYRLQDQGFDTVDANIRLGFEPDERIFEPAAEMLRRLGFSAVRLLTNNPEKVAGLEACGIRVAERVAHAFPANEHNEGYLDTKRKRSGHYL